MIGFDNPPSEGSSYVQNSSDKFTSLGTVTRFLNSFKFEPSFKWIIDLNNYAEPVQFNVNVATADPGLYRKDICYATTDNQLHYLSGEASTTVAIAPILPLNSLLLGSWTIFGDVISDFVPRVNGLQLTVEAGDSFEKTIGDFEYIFNVFKYYFSYYMYLITIRNTADGSYSSLRVSEAGAYIESGNGFVGRSGGLSLEPALEPNLFSRTAYGDNSFKIPFRTVVGDATFRPPNNLPAGDYTLPTLETFEVSNTNVSGTYTADLTNSAFRLTLTGNTTLNLSNVVTRTNAIQTFIFYIRQDATGSRTLSLAAGKFRGTATINSAANSLTIITGLYSVNDGRMSIVSTTDTIAN